MFGTCKLGISVVVLQSLARSGPVSDVHKKAKLHSLTNKQEGCGARGDPNQEGFRVLG